MSNDPQRELGRLEAEVMNLKSDIDELKGDVKQILAKLNEDKGMFKAIGWGGTGIAAAAGALGGTIAKKLGLSILAVLALLPLQAWAHGSASWIMANPSYVDRLGTHCCGPVDCEVAKPGEIQRIPGGWMHVPTQTSISDDEAGVYLSIDAQLWRCVRGGQLKCVFPGAGL